MMLVCAMGWGLLGAVGVMGPREADRQRITRHLVEVTSELRAADVRDLSPDLRRARAQHIDRLAAYAKAGRFPINETHRDRRVPVFIDDEGTACAVGHLMIASGAEDVAREIAAADNNALVPEITHRGAAQWIASSGLSVAECARIQPNYCGCPMTYEPVCGVDGQSYVNECTAVQCAMVEVAHEGVCVPDPSNATDWPAPGESGAGSSESSAGSGGTSESTSTGVDASTTSGASGGASTDAEPDEGTTMQADERSEESQAKGCRIGSAAAGPVMLVLLATRRRRRR